MPEKIQDPIAIFASETHPEDSIVALIELTDKNGKSVIIPIEINGVSKNSGYDIDVNRIKTAFGKKNALNLLRNALNSEMLGENTLFYWQKKKAISLAHSGGVQFPTTVPNLDGFIHSISENKNLVNTKVLQQTNTKQFKRWFGDWRNHPQKASKAVNEDGTPMILYHGTDEKFTEFDTERKRTRGNLNFGKGIYLTPKRNLAEMYSSTGNVMELYAAVKTPYEFFGARFGAEDLNELTEKFGEEVRIDNVNTILQKNGYDGIIARDYNGTTNPINQIVVFDASQLKSATENIGTFDKTNPDIRYSERHTYETARELLLQAAKETGKTDRSSPLALLVRVSLVFKKETSGKGRVSGISLIFSLFNIRSKRKGKPLALWRKGQDSYFLHKVSLVLSYQRKNRSLTDSP